jgi:D-amino peptidase
VQVLISVDLEGVAGVATRQQTLPGGRDYERSRALMTAEANAAIRGAFDGGADSVLVTDSHGPADNLLADQLDPRARLIFGDPKPLDMLQGISDETGVVMFVGYHAGAADDRGVLGHTFSGGAFSDVRLGSQSITEAELNGLVASEFGVPVGLVTGDDVICTLAERAFPGTIGVPVKQAIGRTAATSMHPEIACAAIADGARRAVESVRLGTGAQRPRVPSELVLEADLRPSGAAELVALVPGTERVASRTVRFTASSAREALEVIIVWSALVSSFVAR